MTFDFLALNNEVFQSGFWVYDCLSSNFYFLGEKLIKVIKPKGKNSLFVAFLVNNI